MIYSSTYSTKMENANDKKSKIKNVKSENVKSEKINVKLNKNFIDDSGSGKEENKKVKNKDNNITFIIVEKNGSLKDADIKEGLICTEELSKKCKFKKVDGFIKRTEWNYSSKNEEGNSSHRVIVELWAKDDGVANHENKYEFPPPVDTELFFGACALIARDSKNNYINLTKDKWNKIYEYLFGGFESLVANEDDDEEEDELESVPKNRKTRDGYLKDGFVVDGGAAGDSDIDVAANADEDASDADDDSDTDSDNSSEDGSNDGDVDVDGDGDGDVTIEDIYLKKNRNIVNKNELIKTKPKNKNSIVSNDKYILKDDDDDSGWKTDESSELSEEEYSYSK